MLELPVAEQSFWRKYYQDSIYPELTKDRDVDVAIVGAGITGLTAAYLLKTSGLKVAILEKSTVGGGTTGRTTGKVTSQHGLIYHDLSRRLGKKTAQIYGDVNQAAVEQVDSIIRKEKIDCDWQRADNYVFTAVPDKLASFKQEAKTAKELGLPATFETETPLPFAVRGAVKFSYQAKINSQKYLLGLARAVDGDGSNVFEHSRVIGIRDGDPGRIKTSKATVRARHIIVATNVPTFPLLARGGYCLLEYPTESFGVALKSNYDLSGMYISPDKDHYSILPVQVDGENTLIIVGAGGNLAGFRINKEDRHRRLAGYGQKHFGISSVTHRWSDRDYFAYDGIPLIGKLYPWSKNLYAATAFRKWGLTNGTVAGTILNDLITGKENAWATTFNSSRLKPITSIPRAVVQHIKGSS